MVKRALLIGINYFGQSGELRGCINDIEAMQTWLTSRGFTEFTVLRDDRPDAMPTRSGILAALATFLAKVTATDTAYIHYSGHGTWTPDTSGDEADFRDECICPVDYAASGVIKDDELNKLVCSVRGGKIRVVFDSCHSGSALDLPIRWVSGSKTFRENSTAPLDAKGNLLDVVFFSGCQDNQTSADAHIEGGYSGALTHSWLQALADAAGAKSPFTWRDLGNSCQLWLKKNGYSQIPQIGVCTRTHLLGYCDL